MARDDFSATTKTKLAQRVAYKCSKCMQSTIGPQQGNDGTISTGEASHICAASPGGPRYDPNMTPAQRSSIDNGIWLCRTCAALIDRDVNYYTVARLQQIKKEAEQRASDELTGLIRAGAPRFQVDIISCSGGLSSLGIRITNVSSVLISRLTSKGLYTSFSENEIEMKCNTKFDRTILDKAQYTEVYLNNGFFGVGDRIHMTKSWTDFNLIWRFSCEDERGREYTFEAWKEISDSNKTLLGNIECSLIA